MTAPGFSFHLRLYMARDTAEEDDCTASDRPLSSSCPSHGTARRSATPAILSSLWTRGRLLSRIEPGGSSAMASQGARHVPFWLTGRRNGFGGKPKRYGSPRNGLISPIAVRARRPDWCLGKGEGISFQCYIQ